ncbi:MAG TPA: DUF6249 domain-containing protein [Usitatibacteraceae bacterium]|nr:DUF6249 domain-containing protein [Usitatibacteraceae bacterium]
METSEVVVAMTGMLAGLGLPLLVIAIVLFYKHQRNRMRQETILKLAEKGLPVPPELFRLPEHAPSPKGGLVLLALGIALSAFFWERGQPWSIGLIPGLMGVALLIAWKIDSRKADRREPPR